MVKNANCPKDQYMMVKNASYRGLSATKTCGLSDDYSCEVDVTCPRWGFFTVKTLAHESEARFAISPYQRYVKTKWRLILLVAII